MATLEQILEEARALSPEERRQLREALDREEVQQRSSGVDDSNRAREQQWVAEHRDEYVGQWVALEGDHLIAHGHDARAVYTSAREAGIQIPFVVRVEAYDEPSMGGWQ
jgi:hypothetical protein